MAPTLVRPLKGETKKLLVARPNGNVEIGILQVDRRETLSFGNLLCSTCEMVTPSCLQES